MVVIHDIYLKIVHAEFYSYFRYKTNHLAADKLLTLGESAPARDTYAFLDSKIYQEPMPGKLTKN